MKFFRWLLICSITFSFSNAQSAEQEIKTYTVGVVPQFESRILLKIWKPILEQVSRISNTRLVLKPSPSIPEFEQQFSRGDFDLAYMNPYHLIVANEKQGYKPVLKDIKRKLFGIIVVKKNSPLQTVEELNGKTIAFPSPNALGAALIPRTEFNKKFKIKVKENYVKSHSSVYLNVVLGLTDAGGGVQKTLSRQSKDMQDKLRILYKTRKVSSHPIAAHPRVSAADLDRIVKGFLELGANTDGSVLLSKVPFKKIGTTNIKDYQELKKMGLSEFYVD